MVILIREDIEPWRRPADRDNNDPVQREFPGPDASGTVMAVTPAATAAVDSAPRMIEVARLAGVSQQTVSRVLNESAYVSDELRQRVLRAVLELGYRRNRVARALVTRQTMHIGVILTGPVKYGASQALFGVAAQARKFDYATSIVSLEETNHSTIVAALNDLVNEAVDGIIVLAQFAVASDSVNSRSTSVPLIMYVPGEGDTLHTIAHNEEQAAYTATRHLLDLGHPTVHHLAGPEGWPGTDERIKGWSRALAEDECVRQAPMAGDWSAVSGYEVGRQILAKGGLTAVFVANDQMALGFLKAVKECGLRVPEDISVVGFDDFTESPFFEPALTTMHLDFVEAGRKCVDRIIELIRGNEEILEPLGEPYLVVRSSTAQYSVSPRMSICG